MRLAHVWGKCQHKRLADNWGGNMRLAHIQITVEALKCDTSTHLRELKNEASTHLEAIIKYVLGGVLNVMLAHI